MLRESRDLLLFTVFGGFHVFSASKTDKGDLGVIAMKNATKRGKMIQFWRSASI